MRHLREVFTDREHAELVRAKGELTWHDFIMTLVGREDLVAIVGVAPKDDEFNTFVDFYEAYRSWLNDLRLHLKSYMGGSE